MDISVFVQLASTICPQGPGSGHIGPGDMLAMSVTDFVYALCNWLQRYVRRALGSDISAQETFWL